ncbi:hypothetical protein ACFXAZ_33190 [Streptomyces sp. NPDC059477]|uniref:hypothetical protein n=1 Tax=Streptomyces sp. NPDC059477 TaxID=3346847 RepID=UPI003678C1D6
MCASAPLQRVWRAAHAAALHPTTFDLTRWGGYYVAGGMVAEGTAVGGRQMRRRRRVLVSRETKGPLGFM